MTDRDIVGLLACPACHRPLQPLPDVRLAALNRLIETGEARYVDGEVISEPVEAALITDNDTLIYRIDDGIPVLLTERGIVARQIIDP